MYTDKVAKVSVSEKLFHVLITLSWIINQGKIKSRERERERENIISP